MKVYELLGYKERHHQYLGILKADNMEECALFIAKNFPEYYYGANIKELNASKDYPDFMCIPIKDYFKNDDGSYPSPIEVALDSFNTHLKIQSGLCDVEEEWNGDICRQAWAKLEIPFKGRE
jgi:hypothetical protein